MDTLGRDKGDEEMEGGIMEKGEWWLDLWLLKLEEIQGNVRTVS